MNRKSHADSIIIGIITKWVARQCSYLHLTRSDHVLTMPPFKMLVSKKKKRSWVWKKKVYLTDSQKMILMICTFRKSIKFSTDFFILAFQILDSRIQRIFISPLWGFGQNPIGRNENHLYSGTEKSWKITKSKLCYTKHHLKSRVFDIFQ